MKRKKIYVIFNGENAGIYDSWEECEYRICYRRLRYKGFSSTQDAIDAIQAGGDGYLFIEVEAHADHVYHQPNQPLFHQTSRQHPHGHHESGRRRKRSQNSKRRG